MGWFKRLFSQKKPRLTFEEEIAVLERRMAAQDADAIRSRPRDAPPDDDSEEVFIPGNGTFDQEVVGESHYQDALARIAGGQSEDGANLPVSVTLVFEDSNPHDSNAIATYIGVAKVGYLPRDVAPRVRSQLAAAGAPPGVPIRCQGVIRGGWSRGGGRDVGAFGVWLDFHEHADSDFEERDALDEPSL